MQLNLQQSQQLFQSGLLLCGDQTASYSMSAFHKIKAYFKILALAIFVTWVTPNFFSRFHELRQSENPIRNRIVLVTLVLASVYALLSTAYSNIRSLKIINFLIFSTSAITYWAYFTITNQVIEYGELNTLWLSRADWKAALHSYSSAVAPSLFLIVLLCTGMFIKTNINNTLKRYIAPGIFITPLILISIGIMVEKKGGAAATGLPEHIKSISLLGHITFKELSDTFDDRRTSIQTQPKIKTEDKAPNIILIIDESIRGDFLSINNTKSHTTPTLESINSILFNFGYASTSHDCSHYANSTLRYGTNSHSPRESLLTNPTIWAYAKEAGYSTTYIDAQRRMGQLQNFMSPNERKQIDKFIQFDSVDAVERSNEFVHKDESAAEQISKSLTGKNSQLIIVNKEGAHTPYEGKYPESAAKFTPKLELGESIFEGQSRIKLVNSYRNAVSWSVDHFFKILLSKDIDLTNTVIIYTGDHGQNLLNSGIATHCTSLAIPEIGVVPLFFITKNTDASQWLKIAVLKNFNKASHFNLFKTLLKIMGYDTNSLQITYDPDLTENLPDERIWYTGDIISNNGIKHRFEFSEKNIEKFN